MISKNSNGDEVFKVNNAEVNHVIERFKLLIGEKKHKNLLLKFAKCNLNEENALNHLFNHFDMGENDVNLKEILQGAHVKLDDQGSTYKIWKNFTNLVDRTGLNSHHSANSAFSFQGNLMVENLVGDYEKNKDKKNIEATWFQLEAHPVRVAAPLSDVFSPLRSLYNMAAHLGDYFKYKIRQKQQGPEGESIHIQSNPLILIPKGFVRSRT